MNSLSPAADLAHQIALVLRADGHQAWFVGGCVRDRLLNRAPKDFDVATDAHPDVVLRLFPGANHVGAHFGVVIVVEADVEVQVATFRSDFSYLDGRHPSQVNFETSPREDALRRDFTINGLFEDPETGDVLDFVNGLEDLRAGIVRAIGEPESRFREDQLRLLRAVKFAARLGFRVEDATLAAMRALAPEIRNVSAERVRDELTAILTEGGARRGFELLDESGLLPELLPEVAAMKGVQQPPEFHPEGDVWVHTLIMLEGLQEPTSTLAWGVLLHDVGKPPTFQIADRIRFNGHVEAGVQIARRIMNRLRFSHADMEQVEALIVGHMKFMDLPRMRPSTLKRFLRQPHFDQHLALHRLDCLSSHGDLDNYDFAIDALNSLPEETLRPKPLVTGTDLIEAGYRPGPRFSSILSAVEEAQLEGSLTTSHQALAWVAEQFPVDGETALKSERTQD